MYEQFFEWLKSTLFPHGDNSVTAEPHLLGGQKRKSHTPQIKLPCP